MTTHLEDRLHIRKLQGMLYELLDALGVIGGGDHELEGYNISEEETRAMRMEAALHNAVVETPRPVVRTFNVPYPGPDLRAVPMVMHKNRIKHDPENGQYGDCHRACVATILGMDSDEVPHFYGDPGVKPFGQEIIDDFLHSLGLTEANVYYTGDTPLEDILKVTAHGMPGCPAILGGKSRAGTNHSVVILDGKIVNDPTENGIVGPLDNDIYCVTILSTVAGFPLGKALRNRAAPAPHAADAAIAGLKSLHDVVEETQGMKAPHDWDEDPSWRGKLESLTAAERDAYLRSNGFSTPTIPAGAITEVEVPGYTQTSNQIDAEREFARASRLADAGPVQPAPKYRNPLESAPPPSAAQEPPPGLPITATYRNYKGEVEDRSIIPMRLYVGTSQWHPEAGWLLEAYDLGKSAIRTFSLKDFEFANLTAIRSLRKAAAFDKIVEVHMQDDRVNKIGRNAESGLWFISAGLSGRWNGATLLEAVEAVELPE